MAEVYATWLVTSLLVGATAAIIAEKKGRNPLGWFVIGVVLNIAALAAVLLVNNLYRQRKEDAQ